jgi:hypothetical protein
MERYSRRKAEVSKECGGSGICGMAAEMFTKECGGGEHM